MLTLLKTTAATQMARIPPTASQRIRSPSLSHAMCAVRWTRITHSTHSTQSTQTQAQAHKTNNKHSNLRLFGLLLSPLTASLVPTTTTAAPTTTTPEPTTTTTEEPGTTTTAFDAFHTLGAVADATMYIEGTANGDGSFIIAGRSGEGDVRRGLIQFDVGSLPEGVRVTEAQLILFVVDTAAGAATFDLHRVTSPWTEGSSDPSDVSATHPPPLPSLSNMRNLFVNTIMSLVLFHDCVLTCQLHTPKRSSSSNPQPLPVCVACVCMCAYR